MLVVRRADVLDDLDEKHRHEVEHDEVELRPDLRRAEESGEERGSARRPKDDAQEEGNEVKLQMPSSDITAPDEIHDEEGDECSGDGKARHVDGIADADFLEEGQLAANEEIVYAAKPPGIVRMQEESDAFPREGLLRVDEVQCAPIGVVETVPLTGGVDQTVIEVDAEVLIRRRREDVINGERYILRDLPREIDRLHIVGKGRHGGRIGLPVMFRRVETKDVVMCEILADEGVRASQISIRHGIEQLPGKGHGPDDCGERSQSKGIFQRVLCGFLHRGLISPALFSNKG